MMTNNDGDAEPMKVESKVIYVDKIYTEDELQLARADRKEYDRKILANAIAKAVIDNDLIRFEEGEFIDDDKRKLHRLRALLVVLTGQQQEDGQAK